MFNSEDFKAAQPENDKTRMYVGLSPAYPFVLLEEAKRMRELLHAVNESTGPGACESQLTDALQAVSAYLSPLNEIGK